MPVTEAARHHPVSTLETALDPEAAMTLAELLPPAGWSEVATKADLDARFDRFYLRMIKAFAVTGGTLLISTVGVAIAAHQAWGG
jgi:hypothetical protein